MEFKEVIGRLEEMGDERARKVWSRVGMDTRSYFGVNLTKCRKFAREVGKEHDLARKLWASGIHDAQLLACHIEEPKMVAEEQIDLWIDDVDFMDLCDKFATEVVWKTIGPRRRWSNGRIATEGTTREPDMSSRAGSPRRGRRMRSQR